MTIHADQLHACEHYVAIGEMRAAKLRDEGFRHVRADTCTGCGGDHEYGPSCNCPIYGETEDE